MEQAPAPASLDDASLDVTRDENLSFELHEEIRLAHELLRTNEGQARSGSARAAAPKAVPASSTNVSGTDHHAASPAASAPAPAASAAVSMPLAPAPSQPRATQPAVSAAGTGATTADPSALSSRASSSSMPSDHSTASERAVSVPQQQQAPQSPQRISTAPSVFRAPEASPDQVSRLQSHTKPPNTSSSVDPSEWRRRLDDADYRNPFPLPSSASAAAAATTTSSPFATRSASLSTTSPPDRRTPISSAPGSADAAKLLHLLSTNDLATLSLPLITDPGSVPHGSSLLQSVEVVPGHSYAAAASASAAYATGGRSAALWFRDLPLSAATANSSLPLGVSGAAQPPLAADAAAAGGVPAVVRPTGTVIAAPNDAMPVLPPSHDAAPILLKHPPTHAAAVQPHWMSPHANDPAVLRRAQASSYAAALASPVASDVQQQQPEKGRHSLHMLGLQPGSFDANTSVSNGYQARELQPGSFDANTSVSNGYQARGLQPGSFDANTSVSNGYQARGLQSGSIDADTSISNGYQARGQHRASTPPPQQQPQAQGSHINGVTAAAGNNDDDGTSVAATAALLADQPLIRQLIAKNEERVGAVRVQAEQLIRQRDHQLQQERERVRQLTQRVAELETEQAQSKDSGGTAATSTQLFIQQQEMERVMASRLEAQQRAHQEQLDAMQREIDQQTARLAEAQAENVQLADARKLEMAALNSKLQQVARAMEQREKQQSDELQPLLESARRQEAEARAAYEALMEEKLAGERVMQQRAELQRDKIAALMRLLEQAEATRVEQSEAEAARAHSLAQRLDADVSDAVAARDRVAQLASECATLREENQLMQTEFALVEAEDTRLRSENQRLRDELRRMDARVYGKKHAEKLSASRSRNASAVSFRRSVGGS